MHKQVFILIAIVFTWSAKAQQVVPLFRNNSLKTYVTMPFMLQDAGSNPMTIYSIDFITGKSSCAGILDPHIRTNFLLKCISPDTVNMNVYYKQGDEVRKIVYGPLSVLQISDSGVIPPSQETDTRFVLGQKLFQNNCNGSCHTPPEKKSRSFTLIRSAMSLEPKMQSIILTDEEVRAISYYLSRID